MLFVGSCTKIANFGFTNYYGIITIQNYLNCLANEHPDKVKLIEIGKSVEGRTLRVVKISSPPKNNQTKPAVWIDGGIHAREWISPASVLYLVHQLVEKQSNPENKKAVESFDIFIQPSINPDG